MIVFLLFIYLVPSVFSATDYEKFLVKERWLPSEDASITLPPELSEPCRNDTQRWMSDLFMFAYDFNLCYIEKSSKCTNQTKEDIKANVYALKQLDAFGRLPPGILDLDLIQYGSVQECKEVSKHYIYKTHYCWLYSTFSQNDSTCAEASAVNPLTVKTAVCMPASCSEKDIPMIMTALKGKGLLTHCSADCVPEKGHTNTFFWIFVAILSVLVGTCITASIVDFILDVHMRKPSKDVKNTSVRLLLSFSFYTNGSQILDTTPAKEGHIKSLDCIRFFSMLWVVGGHVAILFLNNDSPTAILGKTKPIAADTLANAFFSVDTFLVLSGMLVSFMFFKQVSKNRKLIKNPVTWVLFYVHRYLRLTPPYMLFICFYIAFVPLMIGSNSFFLSFQATVDACTKNWWRNLIYINNFDKVDTCYGITWYLAADTQMYMVAPIFLVALFINHWIGLAVILAGLTGSVGLTFYLMIHYNLPGNLVRVTGDSTNLFMDKIYTKPWIRITPYLIGMYVGYLLAIYPKNKRPKLPYIVCVIGWVLAIAIAIACVYGPHDYLAYETDWSKFLSAFYYSFSRIGWGIFICWVVAANFYGWGGPIAAFMDHPLWQPFGRLSYTAYLVHYFCIYYFVNLFDRPLHFTTLLTQFQTFTIPITVLAYIFAFGWSCICEIPFLKLEKLAVDGLIGSRRSTVKAVEQKEPNQGSWDDEERVQKL